MAYESEQSKRLRLAAEERQKTIEDNQILVNQAALLNKKLESDVQNSEKINDLRAELLDKLIEHKDNLDEQKRIIEDYSKELRVQADLQTNIGKDLMKEVELLEKARKTEEKRVELQTNLQTKADAKLAGLEDQIRKIPIVGDMLASAIDFGGLKKQMGGILKGITQQFVALTAAGVPAGKAIGMSFRGAIKPIISFGASLYAAVAPILPIILAIVGAMYILKKVFEFNKDVAELSRELGIGNDESREMMHNFQNISASSSNLNVDVKSLVEAQKELSKEFGKSAEFSEQMLTDQIQLTKFGGLSGEEAAKFQKISMASGMETRKLQKEIIGMTSSYNELTGDSINFKDINKEIINLTHQQRALFKGNTKEMIATVIQAKALGTTIEESSNAAQKTLDIESSLRAEAKARMLTGVSINNNEIRLAKLAGDTGKVLELQKKQLMEIGDFENMSEIQQNSIAEALGKSTEEILKQRENMMLLEKLNIKSLDQATKEQLIQAGLSDERAEQILQEQEKLAAQEKMDALMSKLGDVAMKLAAPLMDLLDPMMELVDFILPAIGPLLKFAFAPIMLVANIVKGLVKIFKGDIAGGIHEIGAGILEFIYRPFVFVVDLVSGFFPSIGQAIENAFGNLKSLAADILPNWATKLLFGTDDKGNVSGTENDSEGNVVDSINDGVITPGGDVVKTNPSDFIMAMKNPMDLFSGIGNMFGGGGSVSIDYDKLAEAISKQPILLTIDGKAVQKITRVQSRQSVTTRGFN